MQPLSQRRILETLNHRDWQRDLKRKSELSIIFIGAILGFAVIIAVMIYAGSYAPHN